MRVLLSPPPRLLRVRLRVRVRVCVLVVPTVSLMPRVALSNHSVDAVDYRETSFLTTNLLHNPSFIHF